MANTITAYKDLDETTAWAERAAWEVAQVLKDAQVDAEIVDWGVDRTGQVTLLNLNSGDLNFDLAVSREFIEYRCFHKGEGEDGPDQRAKFLIYVRNARPGLFTQNGVSRHLYGLDLEAEDGVEVVYEGDRTFRDFAKDVEAEKAEAARKLGVWEEAEKARKAKSQAKAGAAAA